PQPALHHRPPPQPLDLATHARRHRLHPRRRLLPRPRPRASIAGTELAPLSRRSRNSRSPKGCPSVAGGEASRRRRRAPPPESRTPTPTTPKGSTQLTRKPPVRGERPARHGEQPACVPEGSGGTGVTS